MLPNTFVGSQHRYRIEWDATEVRYFIDGNLVATHDEGFDFGATQMRPLASDLNSGGPDVSVDWLRMSPYPALGQFDSRVFDAGQQVDWGALSWTADTPDRHRRRAERPHREHADPDDSWSDFTPIAASGGDIPGSSRYIQYRAEPSSSDPTTTPALTDVTIAYAEGVDATPPTITAAHPGAGRHRRPASTPTSRSSSARRWTRPRSTARASACARQGAGSDVAANVSSSGTTATLNPDADLAPSAVYEVTVAGSVEDANGNPLGADDTWTFTTAPLSFTDTTVADFGAGTTDADTYVSETDNGEVTLKPTVGEEFSGGAGAAGRAGRAPPGVRAAAARDRRPAAASHVDGAMRQHRRRRTARAARSSSWPPSAPRTFQHVGFTDNFNDANRGRCSAPEHDEPALRAHQRRRRATRRTSLPGALIGSAAPLPDRVGRRPRSATSSTATWSLTHTTSVSFGATQMRPIASDFDSGGPSCPSTGCG